MSNPEILPFAEHLEGRPRSAVRHRRHREAEPLLAATYEDPQACRELIAAAYAAEDASGSVAVDGSRVVGYLLGAPKSETWGQNIWVESAGHAVEEPELARDLYAVAATRWLDEGRPAHYALLPSHDTALVHAWFRLAFGWQHTHAVREPAEAGPLHEGLTVRQPERSEIPALARLDMVLPEHQHQSPVLLRRPPRRLRGAGRGLGGGLRQPEVLERRGRARRRDRGQRRRLRARGVLEPRRAAPTPATPPSSASRRPSRRPAGSASAGRWARPCPRGRCVEGYTSIVTDWRETNLLSSRAWRGLGYRDTFTRVHRLVGSLTVACLGWSHDGLYLPAR